MQGMIPKLAHELIDDIADRRGGGPVHARSATRCRCGRSGSCSGSRRSRGRTSSRWNQGMMLGSRELRGRSGQAGAGRSRRAPSSARRSTRVLDRLEERPDGSVLSWMLHHDVDGDRMSRTEIVANTKLMLSGGLQEPRDLIALAVWSLGTHPEQLDEAASDRSLVKKAVEETLRWCGPGRNLDATDHEVRRPRGGGAPGGRADRRRALVGQPGSAPVHRSRSVRPASERRRAPGVRDRYALLLGGMVRAPSGARVARDPPRSPPQPAPRSRAAGRAPGVGVPGSDVDVGPVGPMRHARSPARAETVGSLLRPAALRAAVERFYDEGHSAVLAEERAKDAQRAEGHRGRSDQGGHPPSDRVRARCDHRR